MPAGELSPSSASLSSLSRVQGWTGSSPCPLFFAKSLTLYSGSYNNPSLILLRVFGEIQLFPCAALDLILPLIARVGGSNGQLGFELMKKAFQRCISSADTARSPALFCIAVLLWVSLVKSQPDWKSCHHHCGKPALVIAPLDTLRVAGRPIKA